MRAPSERRDNNKPKRDILKNVSRSWDAHVRRRDYNDQVAPIDSGPGSQSRTRVARLSA